MQYLNLFTGFVVIIYELVGGELFFGDTRHNLGHFHLLSLFQLLRVGKEGEENRDSMTDHGYIEVVFCLKILKELSKGDVAHIHIQTIPGGPIPLLSLQDRFCLRRR
ncbi:hypothetical protein ACHAXS_012698, partial [Conticribra weissflogii]